MSKNKEPATDNPEFSTSAQALAQLNSGEYRDAIELYKTLPMEEREIYSQHIKPPHKSLSYCIAWHIQAKNTAEIQQLLKQLTAKQLDKDYPDLAAWLGFLVITDHPEFGQELPKNSAFALHLALAQKALQSYQTKNWAGVDETLKQLPYRSAFKDFRSLLKAAIITTTSITDAQALLATIPANSPYWQSAKLLLACTQKGSALAFQMTGFNPQKRELIGEIKAFDEKQLKVIERLSQQTQPLSDPVKFNLAIQYQSLFGLELTQKFCLTMLATYPAGKREYENTFGSLDPFEENRLKALIHEKNNGEYDTEFYWRQCLKVLRTTEPGNSLKAALILRRIATGQDESKQVLTLIESLDYDSEDRDSYLKILRYYGQNQKETDNNKRWLAKALQKFPQDIDVLTFAIAANMRNKAFEEAIQHALEILKADPLNYFAKKILFESHLAQARKLMQGKNYPLANSEIQQMETLKMGKSYVLHVQLIRSFFCFADQDKEQGLNRIVDVLSKMNPDPVNAHFQGALEALLTGLPVATILKELAPLKDHVLPALEMERLILLLKDYSQDDSHHQYLFKALEKIKATLKNSVQQQNYPEDLLLRFCQALDIIQHFELLRACAKWAQTQWQKPIWAYYRIYSETNGNPEKCSFKDGLDLQDCLNQATREKDQQAIVLLRNYFDRFREAHPDFGTGVFKTMLNDDVAKNEVREGLLGQLFGHLSVDVLNAINKKMDALTKTTTPEQLIAQLTNLDSNQAEKALYAMMEKPDLFTALLMLKASNQLDLAIGVSVQNVLDCFGQPKKRRFFFF